MAARSWTTSIATAFGVAAGAGAAQLGVGYGLNIVTWAPATDEDTARTLWLASLAWVAWLAANSTVFGALCADRLTNRDPAGASRSPIDVVWRIVIALAAATGALVSVPLVAIPARLAPQANNATPEFTAGAYAIIGILVGIVIAVGALHARAIATNVIASAGWLWILAVVAVAHGLRSSVNVGSAQLATWQFAGGFRLRGMVSLPSALLMLAAALMIGFFAALSSGRRGEHRVGVVISGATGPLLVTAAYFLALPGLDGSIQQLSAAVVAPYTVIAGLAGSALVSAIGPRGSRAKARAERDASDEQLYEEWQRAMGTDPPGQGGGPSGEEATVRLSGAGTAGTHRATDDLADDAYAPARAYSSERVKQQPAKAGKLGKAAGKLKGGRSSTPDPIWPDDVTTGKADLDSTSDSADPAADSAATSPPAGGGGKGGKRKRR